MIDFVLLIKDLHLTCHRKSLMTNTQLNKLFMFCCVLCGVILVALQWRHHWRDSVWNHHATLTIVYSTVYSKKTLKLRVTGLCAGNSPVTGEFPAQMAINAKNVSNWWRHQGFYPYLQSLPGRHYAIVCAMLLSTRPRIRTVILIKNTISDYFVKVFVKSGIQRSSHFCSSINMTQ